MGEPLFTPGPWHTGGIWNVGDGLRQNVWSATPPGKQSGTVIASSVRPPDASLIVAAPELYAALRGLLESAGFDWSGGAEVDAAVEGAVNAGRAALAKAVAA